MNRVIQIIAASAALRSIRFYSSRNYNGSIFSITVHGYIVKKATSFAIVSNYIADEPAT